MKPMKPLYFIGSIILLNIIFAGVLAWWMWIMTTQFQAINDPVQTTNQNKLNLEGFYQVFPAQKAVPNAVDAARQ